MAIMLKLKFKILTPLFLGNAFQKPELRPPAFKGLLRFWYRAVSADYYEKEAKFFGGTGQGEDLFFHNNGSSSSSKREGQSPFLLRAVANSLETTRWQDLDLRRFDQGHGRNTRNGLVYLGYPFGMRGGERIAFKPGQIFELRLVVVRDQENEELRQAIAASCWLMAHAGGAGSRNRRGFGSFALTDWECEQGEGAFPELKALPLLSSAASPAKWRDGFENAINQFRRWFGPFDTKRAANTFAHPHLGPNFTWTLSEQGFTEWDQAMNAMGRELQDFRLRMAPDYQEVKDYLKGTEGAGGRPLHNAPSRVTFGLPLTFRFSSQRGNVTFMPYDERQKTTRERQGSLLFLRLTSIADRLHPLYLRLDGSVPGIDNPVAQRHHGRQLASCRRNSLEDFLNYVKKES